MILFIDLAATYWEPAASPAMPLPASRFPPPASRLPLPASRSYLKRPAEHAEGGFFHRFAERRMRMYRDADVLRRSAILERLHRFLNQLRHVRSDHVRAEQLVGLGVGNELDEAGSLTRRARARVGGEGEFSGLVLPSARFHFVFSESDRRNLRPGVYYRRHRLVIHVRLLPRDYLSRDDAFVLCLVRE